MELRQVRYFIALSETLNFTHAAKACNITQPTLTNSIRKLEEEMGGPLVHRERANTHLTQLGQMVLPFLVQVYESSCAASRLAQEISDGERVPLNFGVSDVVRKSALLGPLKNACALSDGLEIHVEGGSDSDLLDSLKEGALHMALVEEIAAYPDRLRFFPVYKERFLVLMTEQDPLAAQSSVSLKQLVEHPWIELVGSSAHAKLISALRELDGEFTPRHRATRSTETQVLCQAEVGLTMVGDHEETIPGLITRPLADLELTRYVGLAEARGRPVSSTVQSFSRLLRAQSFAPDDVIDDKMASGSGRTRGSASPNTDLTKPSEPTPKALETGINQAPEP